MKTIDLKSFAAAAENMRRPSHQNCLAMYSSVYRGIVTDPVLMMVPIDDHMVHRGDGVFEAMTCVEGSVYNMRAHLERLADSASAIGIRLRFGLDEIGRTIVEVARASRDRNCYIRLYLSRGPGSFTANPYDCPEPQLYVVATKAPRSFMESHPEGARVKVSSFAPKPPFYARVKSCNYLPNVLMTKEAVEAGVDCMVAFQTDGTLAEGATENVGIVTRQRVLVFPKLDSVLRGTTMMRVMNLAGKLIANGDLAGAEFADIRKDDIREAGELLVVGTTWTVSMVREFDGQVVGDGKPGPVYAKLRALLLDDMRNNRQVLTPAFAP